ncbi:MAG: DUF2017 family protein [Acidimicrobiia bacterium]|nr:DUF2017 family protein [Acidimicrobiia bacterium]
MRLFYRRNGLIHSQLREFDIALLRMVPQLIDTVGPTGADPAADRLSPEVFSQDEERSAEFRRLAGDLIDQGREDDVVALRELIDAVESGEPLTDEQASSWMRAINQARLILGARLGIEDDGWEEASGLSPEEPSVLMLHLLGRIQGHLIAALAGGLPG